MPIYVHCFNVAIAINLQSGALVQGRVSRFLFSFILYILVRVIAYKGAKCYDLAKELLVRTVPPPSSFISSIINSFYSCNNS